LFVFHSDSILVIAKFLGFPHILDLEGFEEITELWKEKHNPMMQRVVDHVLGVAKE